MTFRCDNCGSKIEPNDGYRLARWQGKLPIVCGFCLEKIARCQARVERAARRAA